ncbi:CpaF/VirB11 family protein [Bacteriovorax sp. Seq25_V]|uniref:CpaF/VirB11 family protein n=1 Tax=Bacteriovorax sp. Seq25_V TaxID=1201288 RepID=UPI000551E0C9|nr:ATPase, T2SS/T4P/T4SS family [Bacteriovorax sp. Seq25_V]
MTNSENQKAINFLIKSYKRFFKEELQRSIDFTHESICARIAYENSLDLETITQMTELKDIFDIYFDHCFLSSIVDQEDLFEVIIHGNTSIEVISKKGKEIFEGLAIENDDLETCLNVLGLKNNQNWNFQNPFCSFLLELNGENYRCTLTHSCISAFNSPTIFLRKLATQIFDLAQYGEDATVVAQLIKEKKNIIIAGSTGSGKTSFLKSCLKYIEGQEHVVVIEDTHEISCPDKNFTNMLATGEKNKTMTDFCKYSLRMSPERIILGEIRAEEVVPFTLAMNTGHTGLLSTIHANSANDTLSRLAMLFSIFSNSGQAISYEQILQLICKNIDNVVFLENKKVKEIIEVKGAEGMHPITNQMNELQSEQFSPVENLFFAS